VISNEILALEQFRKKWGIDLNLPSALRDDVEGEVLQWQEDWIECLEQALDGLPKAFIKAAGVRYMFVADDLRYGEQPHDGVAKDFSDKSDSRCIELSDPKWIGLNVSLFTAQHDEIEPDLQITLLDARLLEEIAHLWDYRLEEEGSRYCSVGVEWLRVEFNRRGRRKPFNIPNRRIYASSEEQNAEDWAAAVVWYVFQPDRLRRRAKEHYEFVDQLFERCLSL